MRVRISPPANESLQPVRCCHTSVTGFSRIRSLVAAGFALAVAWLPCATALARGPAGVTRLVRYHGLAVRVPASWPVFDLGRQPRTCVRFNRHALYLGRPTAVQQCPAHAVGRTEAILLTPVKTTAAARTGAASSAGALGGSTTSFLAHGIEVTATWAHDPSAVKAALGRSSLPRAHLPGGAAAPRARAAAVRPQQTGAAFTGLGFDACSAPSSATLAAWSSSPYRAVGVYIGGENEACSQANLNSAWVAGETAAGWHLIPTYVGLQAPGACSGCAAIQSGQAAAEGTAEATRAVADAQALGISPGSPIYYDMEAYDRSGNTSLVLSFLSAWTTQLHAEGYLSGVYSSGGSGITDLASRYGTTYLEPDELWIAQWNGVQSTSSSYVPAGDWINHQRIHQYSGGQDATYGGVRLNIDGDYVDASTVGGLSAPPPPAPSLSVSSTGTGITNLHPSWPREPGIARWEILAAANSNPSSLTPIGTWPGSQKGIALRGTSPYFQLQALGASGQLLGSSALITTPPHLVMIGARAYVSSSSASGSLPAGCYTGAQCHVVTTISDGRTRIARTGSESFAPNSSGMVRFQLYGRGRRLLSRAGGRLRVAVRMRDASGRAVSEKLTLISYPAGPSVPTRQIEQSPNTRVVGLTDFASSRGAGAVLAGCSTAAPCQSTVALSVGGTVIASPHTGVLGAHELGYLSFSLNSQGRAMLARARGTLGVHVALTDGSGTTSARIALIRAG